MQRGSRRVAAAAASAAPAPSSAAARISTESEQVLLLCSSARGSRRNWREERTASCGERLSGWFRALQHLSVVRELQTLEITMQKSTVYPAGVGSALAVVLTFEMMFIHKFLMKGQCLNDDDIRAMLHKYLKACWYRV